MIGANKNYPQRSSLTVIAAILALLALAPLPALAYIGPGAGISFFGSLIGVVVTVFVAIGAILLWPVRRMMKRRKAARAGDAANASDTPAAEPKSESS